MKKARISKRDFNFFFGNALPVRFCHWLDLQRFTRFACKPAPQENEFGHRKRLGKLLRHTGKQAGLTQAAIARALGCEHLNHISHIENAKRILEAVELESFAHLYNQMFNDFATLGDKASSELYLRASFPSAGRSVA